MPNVRIIGGAVTKFGKHLDRNMKSLVAEAVTGALQDAGITKEQLQGAWVGNASQGITTGQECVRGRADNRRSPKCRAARNRQGWRSGPETGELRSDC